MPSVGSLPGEPTSQGQRLPENGTSFSDCRLLAYPASPTVSVSVVSFVSEKGDGDQLWLLVPDTPDTTDITDSTDTVDDADSRAHLPWLAVN